MIQEGGNVVSDSNGLWFRPVLEDIGTFAHPKSCGQILSFDWHIFEIPIKAGFPQPHKIVYSKFYNDLIQYKDMQVSIPFRTFVEIFVAGLKKAQPSDALSLYQQLQAAVDTELGDVFGQELLKEV